MFKTHHVLLSQSDRDVLRRLVQFGTTTARIFSHAHILLLTDESDKGPGWPDQRVAKALGVCKTTSRRTRRLFATQGLQRALDSGPSKRSRNRKLHDPRYKEAIFSILHSPPSSYGFNRTTWRRKDLCTVLAKRGVEIGKNYTDLIIRNAGYRYRHTKTILTSNDPQYREKVDHILKILHHLRKNERFFSIDEFGPVSIRHRGGRRLVPPGERPTVPQIQKSKGLVIITAALELRTNQVTHFYSHKKNSEEMIKLIDILLRKYKSASNLYLSWDAAGWHASKQFIERVTEINSARYRRSHHTPLIRLAPLPTSAQFLNVIESVFSGLATAVIQNSDYGSLEAAKAAIDRYFQERNAFFRKHPKKAGDKIWRRELVATDFREGQNCKSIRFR